MRHDFTDTRYIFNVNLDVNMLIVRARFGVQTCIHMKANTLNDIYFFGRMLYNSTHTCSDDLIFVLNKRFCDFALPNVEYFPY